MEYTTHTKSLQKVAMPEQYETPTTDDGNPKFGRLLAILFVAVVFCGVLTWVMGAYFPDFPNF